MKPLGHVLEASVVQTVMQRTLIQRRGAPCNNKSSCHCDTTTLNTYMAVNNNDAQTINPTSSLQYTRGDDI